MPIIYVCNDTGHTWIDEICSVDIYEVETGQLAKDDHHRPYHTVECAPE